MMGSRNAIAVQKVDCDLVDAAFSELMKKSVCRMNEIAKERASLFRQSSAFEIENISTKIIKESCLDTPFNPDSVKLVSGQKFPDIVADNHFGVEVKTTVKDHWVSTGSSIVESTRSESIDSIYMLFGKLGGAFVEFACRPYQDVLYDITVTHSPRYLINMKLLQGESIFDKMGVSYDTLRCSADSIKDVRRYYRKKALAEGRKEMPWWLTKDDDDASDNSMNLRMWKDLPLLEKRRLANQMLILFPEILNSEFDDAALWLCATKGIINTHFRDIYTAGGKVKFINDDRLKIPLPRVLSFVVNDALIIRNILTNDQNFRQYIEEFNPSLLKCGDPFFNWIRQVRGRVVKMGIDVPIDLWIESHSVLR